ncbi:MAG: hypothetical protein U1E26_12720 [Coriobacteriia bacterium]|nr:hypothetical protein [Coriobacteriia bacterium]
MRVRLAVALGLVVSALVASWAAGVWPSVPWRLAFIILLVLGAHLIANDILARPLVAAYVAAFAVLSGVALGLVSLLLATWAALNAVPADTALEVSAFVAWNQDLLLSLLAVIWTVALASVFARLSVRLGRRSPSPSGHA